VSRAPVSPPDTAHDAGSEGAPKGGTFWQTVRAVGWSFFGVRRNSAFQDDIARLHPLQIIAVGLVAALLFVVALILLVHWVAASSH
jgi:hypothetical protein